MKQLMHENQWVFITVKYTNITNCFFLSNFCSPEKWCSVKPDSKVFCCNINSINEVTSILFA